jgi:probable phosphoglycerate mutase
LHGAGSVMKKSHLFLVRHGETDDNKRGIFQGHGGSGLNEQGLQQAERLARRFASAAVRPATLFSSDLERARQTAEILGDALGLRPAFDPALREIHLGAWQGLSETEAANRFPSEWDAWHSGMDVRRGGGETYGELADRMGLAVQRAVASSQMGATVIVSHGAAIKTFVGRALGLTLCGSRKLRALRNAAVAVLEASATSEYHLLVYNDASHLYDAVGHALEESARVATSERKREMNNDQRR